MHRSESYDLVACADCGAEISLGADRVFLVTEDAGLCVGCAMKRGGVYDDVHDTWRKAPSLSGLQALQRDW
jgi:hypothetical protein